MGHWTPPTSQSRLRIRPRRGGDAALTRRARRPLPQQDQHPGNLGHGAGKHDPGHREHCPGHQEPSPRRVRTDRARRIIPMTASSAPVRIRLRIRLVRTRRANLGAPYPPAGPPDEPHTTRFCRCDRSLMHLAALCVPMVRRCGPTAGPGRRAFQRCYVRFGRPGRRRPAAAACATSAIRNPSWVKSEPSIPIAGSVAFRCGRMRSRRGGLTSPDRSPHPHGPSGCPAAARQPSIPQQILDKPQKRKRRKPAPAPRSGSPAPCAQSDRMNSCGGSRLSKSSTTPIMTR